jgi:hypothetical protein
MTKTLPYTTTSADVILRIGSKIRNPNVREVVSTVLKDGPRAYRIATLYEIIDPATEEHHHWCLRINSFDRTKKSGWSFKPDRSVSLGDDQGSQELSTLATLIQRTHAGQLAQPSGDYHLISVQQMESVRTILKFVRRAGSVERMRLVRTLLRNLDVAAVEPREWLQVFEEFARWISPIGMSPRRVAKAASVNGVDFAPEDRVFLMFGSANRDEAHFVDADKFDLTRDTAKSIAFGAGPHFCAGAAASRAMIADVALPSVFARLNGLRLDAGEPVRIGGWAFRGLFNLPVRWDA